MTTRGRRRRDDDLIDELIETYGLDALDATLAVAMLAGEAPRGDVVLIDEPEPEPTRSGETDGPGNGPGTGTDDGA